MPRPEKVQAVADIKDRFEAAQAVFLAEYAGLSVADQQTLRRSLKQGGAEFKVLKMTLARRAAADLDIESLDELLLGPTGIAFADDDAVTAAKALRDFAKDHDVFTIKGGLLGRDFLTPERINELAEIESREVLLAQIAGAFQAPLSNLAGLLAALPRGMATAIAQLIDTMPAEAADSAPDVEAEAEAGDSAPEVEESSSAPEGDEPEPVAEDTADDQTGDDEVATPEAAADESVDSVDTAGDAEDPVDDSTDFEDTNDDQDDDDTDEETNDDEPAEAAEEE